MHLARSLAAVLAASALALTGCAGDDLADDNAADDTGTLAAGHCTCVHPDLAASSSQAPLAVSATSCSPTGTMLVTGLLDGSGGKAPIRTDTRLSARAAPPASRASVIVTRPIRRPIPCCVTRFIM